MGTVRFLPELTFQTIGTTPSGTEMSMTAAGDKIVRPIQVDEDCTITHVGFWCGYRTGTPVEYKISIQGMTAATGHNDGTILGTANCGYANFTPPADTTWNEKWKEFALTGSVSLTRGQIVTVVIEPVGAINSSNKISIFRIGNVGDKLLIGRAILGGSASTALTVAGIKSSSRYFGMPIQALAASNTLGSTYGNKLTIPATVCSSYKIIGAVIGSRVPSSGSTFTVKLFGDATADSSDGSVDEVTELQAVEVPHGSLYSQDGWSYFYIYFDESTLTTLLAGKTYRLAVTVNGTTGGAYLGYLDVATASDLSAYALGSGYSSSSRTTGNWTDLNTRTYWGIMPILGDITPPAASAGGITTAFNQGFN